MRERYELKSENDTSVEGFLKLSHTLVEEEKEKEKEQSKKNVVEVLLKNGANIDQKNTYGDTPIHTAALEGKNVLVQQMLEAGADIYIANNIGLTARDDDRTG